MKIGILGSGDVGQALGRGFSQHGHDVMIGSRSPQSEKLAKFSGETGARPGTFAEVAAFGDVIVLATLWSGTKKVLDLAGVEALAGKTVIDVTNPLEFHDDGPPTLALGHTDSGGEQVQRWLPDSYVVKAWNSVGNGYMVDPDFPGDRPDMFFCGNHDESKKEVSSILDAFGWNPVDIGGIEGARLTEPLCILWVVYGLRSGTWDHAFTLLKK